MSRLKQFSESFHRHFTRNPNARVALGLEENLGHLPDPSMAAERERIAEARQLVAELDAIDLSALSPDDALDAALARLKLEAEIHNATYRFAGDTTSPQQPRAGDDVGDGIFYLFINDPRPAGDRLRDIHTRLDEVPAYLDSLLARLESPVARWVQMDRDKVEGLPHLFDTIASWADESGFADSAALRSSIDTANAALSRYSSALSELDQHHDLHVGIDTTRRLVELRGITASPDDLRTMAQDFLAEVDASLRELRTRLVAKYDLPATSSVADVHAELNRRFAVEATELDDILDHYRHERDRVVAFCEARELFPIPADQDLKILRTPRFMAPSIPAGAMMPPAPFRKGTKISLVYLTLSEELRDEHTALGIPSMIIHEGIPGHHLQLATAAGHPSVIRRHIDANDQAEGWTTMLEDYMLDIGVMGDLTDEARFVGKRDIARLGARVAIDLFFMSGDKRFLEVGVDCDLSSDDPFVAAGSLLKEVTGFTDGRVQAELNWYSQERGYPLSYLAGNRAVWALRRDAQAHSKLDGDAFAREFHRVFLEAGNMPVSMLRRVFAARGLLARSAA